VTSTPSWSRCAVTALYAITALRLAVPVRETTRLRRRPTRHSAAPGADAPCCRDAERSVRGRRRDSRPAPGRLASGRHAARPKPSAELTRTTWTGQPAHHMPVTGSASVSSPARPAGLARYRRATGRPANRHVLVSRISALAPDRVSPDYSTSIIARLSLRTQSGATDPARSAGHRPPTLSPCPGLHIATPTRMATQRRPHLLSSHRTGTVTPPENKHESASTQVGGDEAARPGRCGGSRSRYDAEAVQDDAQQGSSVRPVLCSWAGADHRQQLCRVRSGGAGPPAGPPEQPGEAVFCGLTGATPRCRAQAIPHRRSCPGIRCARGQ